MQYTCSTALAIPCPTNTLPPAVAYLVYHGAPTENIRVPCGSVDVWRKVLSKQCKPVAHRETDLSFYLGKNQGLPDLGKNQGFYWAQ